jgi:hypothetical protein
MLVQWRLQLALIVSVPLAVALMCTVCGARLLMTCSRLLHAMVGTMIGLIRSEPPHVMMCRSVGRIASACRATLFSCNHPA